jgi:hypothetical protein
MLFPKGMPVAQAQECPPPSRLSAVLADLQRIKFEVNLVAHQLKVFGIPCDQAATMHLRGRGDQCIRE